MDVSITRRRIAAIYGQRVNIQLTEQDEENSFGIEKNLFMADYHCL